MTILLSLLLFFFSFGQLGRISFFRQEVNIYGYELILLLSIIWLFIQYKLKPLQESWKNQRWMILFVAYLFLSYILSSAYYSQFQNIVAILYLLRLTCYISFFFYFNYFIRKAKHKISYIQLLVIGFITIIIGTSAIQYFLYPDLRNIFYEGWDPHLYRMVGVFLEPPISGAIYGLSFFFITQLITKKFQLLKILTLVTLTFFIFLTYSRGTYIGFAASIVWMLSKHLSAFGLRKIIHHFLSVKNRFILVVCVIVIIITGIYMASISTGEGAHLLRTSTVHSRIINIQEGMRVWQKHPLFGVGYNHIRYAREVQQPQHDITDQVSHADASFHSSFIVILVSGGIIGLVMFIGGLYTIGRMNEYALYATIFLSVASLTDNVLLHPFVLLFFFVTIPLFNHPSDK